MTIKFINIPKTGGELFEQNFHSQEFEIENVTGRIYSVGHSWCYPTKIKGWLDWDNPQKEHGKYNDVHVFSFKETDKIATIIRNPFNILIDYFLEDWAWCKRYQNVNTFQEFVDSYIDSSKEFHVPEFKKSLFTQLKDPNGKWLIDTKSLVLRSEQLGKDLNLFSKWTNIDLKTLDGVYKLQNYDLKEYYRYDQLVELTKLWMEDLVYLGYDTDFKDIPEYDKPKDISKRKLKIALCFSGFVRDIDYTKDFWKSLIDKYDIDVYASLWDDENVELGDTIDNFIEIYNPKDIEIENYSKFKKSTLNLITPQINPPTTLLQDLIDYSKEFHTLSMWYKIWKSNMLSNQSDYDVVIRARTDSYIKGNLEIVDNHMFNVPVGTIYTDNFPKSEGINDIFSYGNQKVMNYASTTFLYLMQYLNEGHYMIPPEHFLHVHLSKVDLNIRFFANELVITRKSKGRDDELYNRNTEIVEKIEPSTFINPTPNKNIQWTIPLRDSLKF